MGNRWQALMMKGNKCYQLQKWNRALSYYNQAIALLDNPIAVESPETQQALQGWICGYHNIATTYEQQGLIKCSRDALIVPFHTLLAFYYNPTTSSEMQQVAGHALKITLPPLLEFANKFPSELKYINKIIKPLNTHSTHNIN